MPRYAYVHVSHAYLYNPSAPSCYFTTAVLNDCYSELTAYTALAYSYWAGFHDAYICLCRAHYLLGWFPRRVCMLMSRPLLIPTTAAMWGSWGLFGQSYGVYAAPHRATGCWWPLGRARTHASARRQCWEAGARLV